MIQFTKQTITKIKIKNRIIENLIQFGNTNLHETWVETYSENLAPDIYNIIVSTLQNHADPMINEFLLNLKIKYNETLVSHPAQLVYIQLFSLILFNQLENEADEISNIYLRNLWSEMGEAVIEISLNVNEK
jgi:hypothetical protein